MLITATENLIYRLSHSCRRVATTSYNNPTVGFYSSVPAEAVTIAILKDASFHSWCCLMNRKVKSFKQCYYRNSVWCQKLQVFEEQSCGLGTSPQLFSHSFITLSIRFEVSPEIRCSGASSHYCCYGNHADGSKPFLKTFHHINWELNNWTSSLHQT